MDPIQDIKDVIGVLDASHDAVVEDPAGNLHTTGLHLAVGLVEGDHLGVVLQGFRSKLRLLGALLESLHFDLELLDILEDLLGELLGLVPEELHGSQAGASADTSEPTVLQGAVVRCDGSVAQDSVFGAAMGAVTTELDFSRHFVVPLAFELRGQTPFVKAKSHYLIDLSYTLTITHGWLEVKPFILPRIRNTHRTTH